MNFEQPDASAPNHETHEKAGGHHETHETHEKAGGHHETHETHEKAGGHHETHETHEKVGGHRETHEKAGPGVLYPSESYAIIGACFEVYKEQGSGFVEPVYQECLELELGLRIPNQPQPPVQLAYKGRTLRHKYIPDFICYEKIVVELKAVSELTNEHRAQIHNQLRATGHRLGLLVNFGHYPKVEYERVVI